MSFPYPWLFDTAFRELSQNQMAKLRSAIHPSKIAENYLNFSGVWLPQKVREHRVRPGNKPTQNALSIMRSVLGNSPISRLGHLKIVINLQVLNQLI
jgi:hypothetical protein